MDNYSSLSLENALKPVYQMQRERGSYHYCTLVKYGDEADNNEEQTSKIPCM